MALRVDGTFLCRNGGVNLRMNWRQTNSGGVADAKAVGHVCFLKLRRISEMIFEKAARSSVRQTFELVVSTHCSHLELVITTSCSFGMLEFPSSEIIFEGDRKLWKTNIRIGSNHVLLSFEFGSYHVLQPGNGFGEFPVPLAVSSKEFYF